MAKTRKAADPVGVVVFLTALATILLLLSTFSMPFNKSLYLFRLKATANGVRRYVDFGAFGYCLVPVGMEKSSKWLAEYPNCTGPMFGWEIGKDVTDVLQVASALQNSLPKPITSLLILGPIALGLTFIAFLVALFIHVSRTIARRAASGVPANLANPWHFKALFFGVDIALSCATLTFIVDIIVLLRMKERVSSLTSLNSNLKSSRGDVVLLDGFAWFLLVLGTFVANRLRRMDVRSEVVTEPNAQMIPIGAYEMSNTPQPYSNVNFIGGSPLPPPSFPQPPPDLHDHQNSDPPPPYTAAVLTNTTATPRTPEPLIIQDRQRFNFFRFRNNVSYV